MNNSETSKPFISLPVGRSVSDFLGAEPPEKNSQDSTWCDGNQGFYRRKPVPGTNLAINISQIGSFPQIGLKIKHV